MIPAFEFSSGHLAAGRAYREADEELTRRTGKMLWIPSARFPARRRYHVTPSDVLRHHPDLCVALGIVPCAADCNRAATRYCRAWLCDACLAAREEKSAAEPLVS